MHIYSLKSATVYYFEKEKSENSDRGQKKVSDLQIKVHRENNKIVYS